jgi:hypothetical protein
MAENGIITEIAGIYDAAKGILSTPAGAAVGGAVAGAAITGAVIAGASAIKNSSRRSTSKTRRGRSRDRKFISRQKHEQAYQRRRKKLGKKTYGKYYKTKSRRSTKRIKYTKNGQPYIILKSGKARFIKKR